MTLQCNVVFHWLGAYAKWPLIHMNTLTSTLFKQTWFGVNGWSGHWDMTQRTSQALRPMCPLCGQEQEWPTDGPTHYCDVIMGAIASQITGLTTVYSTVYSGTDQRKHQSSASLAFVRGINRWPVNSPHKWPVTWKMFPFDDVIMAFYDIYRQDCIVDGQMLNTLLSHVPSGQ